MLGIKGGGISGALIFFDPTQGSNVAKFNIARSKHQPWLMSNRKKSIFRQPGAKNFQLVHRSQRDPLIYDPEASEHVLKEFERKNARVCFFMFIFDTPVIILLGKGTQ